jgi:hypothetical protein
MAIVAEVAAGSQPYSSCALYIEHPTRASASRISLDSFAVGLSIITLAMFIRLSYLRRAIVSRVCLAHGFVSNKIPIIKKTNSCPGFDACIEALWNTSRNEMSCACRKLEMTSGWLCLLRKVQFGELRGRRRLHDWDVSRRFDV